MQKLQNDDYYLLGWLLCLWWSGILGISGWCVPCIRIDQPIDDSMMMHALSYTIGNGIVDFLSWINRRFIDWHLRYYQYGMEYGGSFRKPLSTLHSVSVLQTHIQIHVKVVQTLTTSHPNISKFILDSERSWSHIWEMDIEIDIYI